VLLRTPQSVPAVRHPLVLALALFLIACGGAGSGSGGGGDGGGGDDVAVASLLVRWRAIPDVSGYVIHWGTTSGAYTNARDVGSPASDADGVIEFFLDQTTSGRIVYFALTSYDGEGRMSTYSNELSAVVP
jgi:hypothetical protein